MHVIATLSDFPRAEPRLRGLAKEALSLLAQISADKPVLVISPEDANTAALKRAFVAAAKSQGRTVEMRNGESGTVLVRYANGAISTRRPRPMKRQHSEAEIEAEMKRLHAAAGAKAADFARLSSDAQRKLSISAKRNLSRRGAV